MKENDGADIAKEAVGSPYELVYKVASDDLHFSSEKELDADDN